MNDMSSKGLSRRQLLRGLGVGALVTRPVVRTVLAGGATGSVVWGASRAMAADPATLGEWGAVIPGPFPVAGVHCALLHTGRVLLLENMNAYVWDPLSGMAKRVDAPNNFHCIGNVTLPNGDVFAAGGHVVNYVGLKSTYRFLPSTEEWVRGPDMRAERWYPTATTLPGGDVVITAGSIDSKTNWNNDIEVYSPSSGTLSVVGSRTRLRLYPHQWVLPDGGVLVADKGGNTSIVDPADWSWTGLGDQNVRRGRAAGALLPGGPTGSFRAMVMGGDISHGTTATTEIFDASRPGDGWTLAAPMPQPRANMNCLILPDGTLLGVGGTAGGTPSRSAILYDPSADAWTTLASQAEVRGYHSTALLLPDGRVLSTGDNQNPGGDDKLEIFSPPYLFKGARPAITSAPAEITWGERYIVGVDGNVTRAVLIRPSAVTHSNNMNQRHVELDFRPGTNEISVRAPASGNLAPLGYYLLFVLNAAGVPSVARWVKVVPAP